MSEEQVVHDFLATFETYGVDAALPYLAEDMVLMFDTPPLQAGRDEFYGQGSLINEAIPDFAWGVKSMNTQGDQVTVYMRWSGTHTGTLHLSAFVPGAPDIPATGRSVSVPDTFIFTVDGDVITGVHVASGPGEGLAVMLEQLGVQLPS